MRLEEDFSKVYEAEMQELKEFCENHVNSPQEEAEKAEELEFIKKVAELTLSQYERIFDEEKKKKILSLYHLLVKCYSHCFLSESYRTCQSMSRRL